MSCRSFWINNPLHDNERCWYAEEGCDLESRQIVAVFCRQVANYRLESAPLDLDQVFEEEGKRATVLTRYNNNKSADIKLPEYGRRPQKNHKIRTKEPTTVGFFMPGDARKGKKNPLLSADYEEGN